jgi:regulator of nonsense transcripts 2
MPLDFGPYGDAESRAFYEDLPDLLTLTPLTVLGFTAEEAQALRETWKANKDRQLFGAGETADADGVSVNAPDAESVDVVAAIPPGEETVAAGSLDGVEVAAGDKVLVLLQEKLPDCVTKQKADEFAIAYCYINTKNARKRLIEALFKVPRTRFELIPNYARVVASLSRLYPEIGQSVVKSLFGEFYGIMKAKTVNFLDNKIKNIRYIGELVKFGVAPPIQFFTICTLLFKDFTNHNVDVFAALLETCGRYLFLLPHTHERVAIVVENMLRLRRAKNLDLRRQTLLESAYFTVMPPDRATRVKKELTTIQKYIVYLFTKKLGTKATVDSIVKLLRKLPWDSEEERVESFVVKWAMKISRTKHVHIPLVADLMSGLSKHRPNALIHLVDKLLEEIQHSLETPHKREPQRTLGSLRMLSELYNYNAVSSPVIIQTLYHIINFGHEVYSESQDATTGTASAPPSGDVIGYDPRVATLYDPATDSFRALMVCEIVNSCGSYFGSGALKDRMNLFFMYFQRYLLCKVNIPLHIEFAVLDSLDALEQNARGLIIQAQTKAMEAASAREAAKAKGKRPKRAKVPEINLPKEFLSTRYNSMEVVQAAIAAWETNHAAPGVRTGGVSLVAEEVKEEEEEEEEEHEKKLDANAAEESCEENEQEEEDGEGSESEEESSSGEDDGEESDGEAVLRREEAEAAERARRLEEEDEFERAFKDVMQESVVSAQQAAQQARNVDINKMVLPSKFFLLCRCY